MSTARSIQKPAKASRREAAGGPANDSYRDLCSTCTHGESCRGRMAATRPIFFCELFEVPALSASAAVAPAPSVRRFDEEDAGPGGGLCANCAERKDCALPKPSGGVWHCEEYR